MYFCILYMVNIISNFQINCALSDEVSKVNQKISKIDNEKLYVVIY